MHRSIAFDNDRHVIFTVNAFAALRIRVIEFRPALLVFSSLFIQMEVGCCKKDFVSFIFSFVLNKNSVSLKLLDHVDFLVTFNFLFRDFSILSCLVLNKEPVL